MSKRFPSEPKPFLYLPVASPEEYKRTLKDYISHDKFIKESYSGRLEMALKVISEYLFVGSGLPDFKGDKVYESFYRLNGRLTIPGSSIKGAVRSLLEAISSSCSPVEKIKSGKKPIRCKFDKPGDKLCPACRIFGITGYAGRLSFSDARPKNDLKEGTVVKIGRLHKPNINKGKRKFYQQKRFTPLDDRPEKGTVFVEAVKKDTEFYFHIDFFNLYEEEISLVLHAMGINQDYFIKLGGAKPRCFGTVQFIPLGLRLVDQSSPLIQGLKEVNLEESINSWMNNKVLINEEILNQYKEKIKKPDEICPVGNY